jgi:hypothetical protein
MSCVLLSEQPSGDNVEDMDKRGKENQEFGHTTMDSKDSASSEDGSDSEKQWPLPSWPWPVQLCHKCIPMTSTVEGLRALSTPSGYIHHEFEDLFKSADKGCVLCRELRNHMIGRDDAQYSPLSDLMQTWWMKAFKKELVSICGSFVSYLERRELRNLDVAHMTTTGVRQTHPLSEPYEFRARNRFDVFTDAQAPKYLHPNIVAGKEFFEIRFAQLSKVQKRYFRWPSGVFS